MEEEIESHSNLLDSAIWGKPTLHFTPLLFFFHCEESTFRGEPANLAFWDIVFC
jgi:hypothetical protein